MSFTHKTVQFLLRSRKFPGRDYLIEKIPSWLIKPTQGTTVVNTNFGFQIKIDPSFDANIENVIYQRGVYEYGTIDFIQHSLRVGDVFVDVGANIGFLSLAAAAKVGKSGKVFAFEPMPSTHQLLEENKNLNAFEQLVVVPKALGNEIKKATIYSEHQNRGGASIVNQRSEKGVEIEVTRLDEFDFGSKINMLKIDVEGYEWEVLKGAVNTLKRDKPILILEYSEGRENIGNSNEMIQWLKELNIYSIYRLSQGKERPSRLLPIISKTVGLPQHDNIFCLPKNN